MCIGIPMQVVASEPGRSIGEGRGERRRFETALVGPCEPGEWVLVFLDSARERIDAQRAAEINHTLDLLAAALGGAGSAEAGFSLPSAMSAEALAALAGTSTS
jgi:hydrogenase expression/formation protein HypC